MNEHIATPQNISPDDFYSKSDSIYIRIAYSPEEEGKFAFQIRNEMIHAAEELNDHALAMNTFVRGLCAIALEYPAEVFSRGQVAQEQDYLHFQLKDMPDEQAVLLKTPQGNA